MEKEPQRNPQVKCSRCRKTFTSPFVPLSGGRVYCKDCTNLIMRVNLMENELLKQEFAIEQADIELAKQFSAVLEKERSGMTGKEDEVLTALAERMLIDESRRKKVLRQIRRLQKKKR